MHDDINGDGNIKYDSVFGACDDQTHDENACNNSYTNGRIYTITALEPQEKRAWRTSIFIDGKFWRGYDTEIIAELGLYVGQKLARAELDAINHSLEKRRAINRAVLLLSYRGRSIHEVISRLVKAGFSPELADEAVNELKRLGYLDDDDFAQNWMKSRLGAKLYGPRRIKQELRQKGVADELITEKLEELSTPEDEYDRALKLAQSKLTSYRNLPADVVFRRLSQFLLRRGYSSSVAYDVSKTVLREQQDDNNDE
ncbi:MAG TPA: RecX family transcriptional regulator [Candidatus Aquicultor sp.]|jgi:regulatory protein